MTKRVFIIHGWDGYPDEGWFPWLKKELEQKGFQVQVPAMPEPAEPKIEAWVRAFPKLSARLMKIHFLSGTVSVAKLLSDI